MVTVSSTLCQAGRPSGTSLRTGRPGSASQYATSLAPPNVSPRGRQLVPSHNLAMGLLPARNPMSPPKSTSPSSPPGFAPSPKGGTSSLACLAARQSSSAVGAYPFAAQCGPRVLLVLLASVRSVPSQIASLSRTTLPSCEPKTTTGRRKWQEELNPPPSPRKTAAVSNALPTASCELLRTTRQFIGLLLRDSQTFSHVWPRASSEDAASPVFHSTPPAVAMYSRVRLTSTKHFTFSCPCGFKPWGPALGISTMISPPLTTLPTPLPQGVAPPENPRLPCPGAPAPPSRNAAVLGGHSDEGMLFWQSAAELVPCPVVS